MQVTTISFFRYDNWAARLEALSQMARGRFALKTVPGLDFFKMLGTGSDAGFNPRPNVNVNAIFCVWTDMDAAKKGLASSITHRVLRDHAVETYTIYLTPTSARGLWSGVEPLNVTETQDDSGNVAVLTRATVKLPIALQFWAEVPEIQARVAKHPNCAFHIGMAEVPWVQQVTFSLWNDIDVMSTFAHGNCPHGIAVKHVREGNWFKEELYARFNILAEEGTWEGGSPMSLLKTGRTFEEPKEAPNKNKAPKVTEEAV